MAAALADTGLLPRGFYRHLVLEALEAEDFPKALTWLKFAGDPVLAQILVVRLRLLAARHVEERRTVQELLAGEPPPHLANRCRELLAAENRALTLLKDYEGRALEILGRVAGRRDSAPGPPP